MPYALGRCYNALMSRFFGFVAMLAWALWLGGLVTLFICVMTLFSKEHALAQQAAPLLFLAFEKFQLIIAAIALTSTFAWRLSSHTVLLNSLFIVLALASIGAAFSPMYFTKKMEILRAEGRQKSPEFQRLHGQSMMIYCGETGLLLIGGMV